LNEKKLAAVIEKIGKSRLFLESLNFTGKEKREKDTKVKE